MQSNKNVYLGDLGSKEYKLFDESTLSFIEKKGDELRDKCIELLNARGISSSGDLIDSIGLPKITQSANGVTMTIEMADYYDYTNKGVKGWKSSARAPQSPYQYKTKGMDEKGVKSIRKYIQSGAKKTVTFAKYGAYKELEQKFSKNPKKLIEFQVANAVFGIKRYGIEARHWFDDAVKEVFGDFEKVMAEQIGRQISVTIKL
jgi:hypothetical protein